MKIALITTTINVPKVLALYRKLGPDVRFFVAADWKTAHEEARALCAVLGNADYFSPQQQQDQHYKCSELLGWNNDSRRNIALLEAVKWGAEIIVSVDDDMIPLSGDFFQHIEFTLTQPFSGLQVGVPGGWVDAGQQTIPAAKQRGIPLNVVSNGFATFTHNVQVGAMQGIILGTPDTDSLTMGANKPFVHSATDILRCGFVARNDSLAVFNSQFTAFRRELAPCFAQFYKWQGRNTDIFASLIMRRVMRETNLHTYFGPPLGFHARTPRDPLKELKAEMWGLENIVEFQRWLDGYTYMSDDKTPLEMARRIYSGMPTSILPAGNTDCAMIFLEDMESVL